MNFTREPIIETVITPREGCKLLVRSSKGVAQEDYYVDAVEVVSFGHSFFFRSQERPKSFLVPVSDYEVLETKEARMVLKNPSSDQSIKIGGGRPQDPTLAESRPADRNNPQQMGKRDNNKRRRNRRGRDRHHDSQEPRQGEPPQQPNQEERAQDVNQEERREESRDHEDLSHRKEDRANQHESFQPEEKAPSFISKLFPPPPTLIKETLSRYKPAEGADEASNEIFDHPQEDREDDNEE